ncbi:MAG: 50S ribosomal protein L22 [Alphaproteobacteria bacterium]|nr:50S ribosomal protein L22 [Alphaproteobacteria bacterium]
MGKPATPRQLHETEASAYARALKTSPRKLNLVAQAIRGKAAAAALNELAFNRRRIARDVRKVLQAAIANAENNHQLDVDRLYVKEATVGRAFSLGRFHVRGRGRISPVEKYFSNLLVVVRERVPEERAKDEDKGEAEGKSAGAGKKLRAKAKAGGKEKA